MTSIRRALVAVCLVVTPLAALADPERWQREVRDAEIAFARSMAERDHGAFIHWLADDARFFGSGRKVLQGRAAVAAGWKAFYDGPQAPFSWEPDQIEVLNDGSLALSSGPVRDPQGKIIARFNSIWRQEAPGRWRVIFDKGQPPD